MAILPPKRGSKRRPSMRGNLLQDTTRGVERNRAWPEPRGSRQTRAQREQTDWFRQANWAFKLQDPKTIQMFTEAAAGTSLYPRDIFSIMAAGGLFSLVKDDGKVMYPMQSILAVSESLDVITQTIGATLVRGPERWTAGPLIPPTGKLSTRAVMSADKALPASGQIFAWDAAPINELQAWSSPQASRLTVPASITRVELGFIFTATGGAAGNVAANIYKNGQIIAAQSASSGYAGYNLCVLTGPIDVTPGDYFEAAVARSSAAAKTLVALSTGFWMSAG